MICIEGALVAIIDYYMVQLLFESRVLWVNVQLVISKAFWADIILYLIEASGNVDILLW